MSWSGLRPTAVYNVTGSTNTAITKLMKGYPADLVKQVERAQGGNQRRKPRPRTADQLTFRLPFIIKRVDREIRRALDRHRIEARLVHPKPRTLLQLAQPKVEPLKCKSKKCPINYIDCMRTHVVYEITCELCKATYIWSTVRALHERAKEHLALAKNKTKASAMGVYHKTGTRNPIQKCASGLCAPQRGMSCD